MSHCTEAQFQNLKDMEELNITLMFLMVNGNIQWWYYLGESLISALSNIDTNQKTVPREH